MSPRDNQSTVCPHGLISLNCLQCRPGLTESGQDFLFSNPSQRIASASGLQSNGQTTTRPLSSVPIIRDELRAFRERSGAANAAPHAPHASVPQTPAANDTAVVERATLPPIIPNPTQFHVIKRPYNPQPNRAGAEQTYSLNRFFDEAPGFQSLSLMPDEERSMERNKRHCNALLVRLRALEAMIGA